MFVVMRSHATPSEIGEVIAHARALGYEAREVTQGERVAVGLWGGPDGQPSGRLASLPGVLDIVRVSSPHPLASRALGSGTTRVAVAPGVVFGGEGVVVMAGPCAVEDEDQVLETARAVRAAGGMVLRGGAFKPRTSPYSFQGLGGRGLAMLDLARRETGLAIVTEAVDLASFDAVEEVADLVQIGARNMQHYPLLRRAGRSTRPVLLKRGLSATLKELLLAAEYILAEGNARVILCERGVRSFEDYTRNMLDLAAIPALHELSHLPVVADPSHGTGRRSLVPAMAKAALTAGADGLLLEVHPFPGRALSDGSQSMDLEAFARLMQELPAAAAAAGRTLVSTAAASGS
ncbi:MAG: 3-deoxy-7-phosphoheptulonate synthase [Candidatus Sericytochromatia bacterium]|nr:3-deoxy-7-phosphoheptulonate synthase [Candidatus Sericytochromatia bacterium]